MSRDASVSKIRISQVVAIVAILFILPALLDARLTYTYYLNLRWIVLIGCVVIGTLRYTSRSLLFLSISMAVTFNPFYAFHFTRDTWRLIDLLAVIAMAWVALGPIQRSPKSAARD